MERRHRAVANSAEKAVADDQIGARPKPLEERHQGHEIIAAVGVAHRDIGSARRGDAAAQRRAVAALGDGNDARAAGDGDRDRAVGRAIVGDDYLAAHAVGVKEAVGAVDDLRQRFRLVEAGDDDGQLERFTRRGGNERPARALALDLRMKHSPAPRFRSGGLVAEKWLIVC